MDSALNFMSNTILIENKHNMLRKGYIHLTKYGGRFSLSREGFTVAHSLYIYHVYRARWVDE